MAQQIITLGERGDAALSAINGNFTELYSTITQPLKFKLQAANFQPTIPANTYVDAIFVALANGSDPATVRIGTTPNGTELSEDFTPDGTGQEVDIKENFPVDTIIYFTISGGTVNIRVNIIPNFY